MDPKIIATTPELNNNDGASEELRRVYGFRHVEDVRKLMVKNDDAAKKVVVLEFGWTVDPLTVDLITDGPDRGTALGIKVLGIRY